MAITEPMTVLTDFLLVGWTLMLGLRLLSGGTGSPHRWWGLAFCAAAVAAFSGGVWHGWVSVLPLGVAQWLWTTTLWSIGAASACYLLAVAQVVCTKGVLPWVRLTIGGKLLLYMVWSLGRDDFLPALVDYAPTLLLILLVFAARYLRNRDSAARWICPGILLSFVAAGVQAAQLAPHRYFNHNDLYHLLQGSAFWLLYRGGLLLDDRPQR